MSERPDRGTAPGRPAGRGGLGSLLRGSMLYTLGNFLPRVGAFLLLPVYARTMPPADFGVFSLMLSLSGLLAIVYRLGLDGALMRLHFDVDERRRPALYATLTGATLVAAIGLTLLLAAIGAPIFERLFAGVAFWPIGALTLLLTFLMAFQYVPASLYRATEQPGRFVAFTAGVFVLGVAATLIFLAGLHLGAAGALLGQIVGALAIVGVTLVILTELRPIGFDRGMLRAAFGFGLPLVPHSLSAWVLNLSDRFLIGLLIGLGAVGAQQAIGIYSFGYQLGQVVSLVALSFNAAWVPYFYANGERPEGPSILREMTTLASGALAVLAVGMAAIAPEVTTILVADRWGATGASDAAAIVPLVATASLAYGLYFMVVSAVFLVRRTRLLPLITLGAGIANVATNIVLIPRIGITGAAIATLAGYGVLTAATTIYARRGYPLVLDGPRIALLFGGAVAAMLLARLVTFPDALAASGAVHVAIALAFAALAFLVIRGPVARLRQLMRRSPSSSTPSADGTMAPAKENP